MSIIYAALVDLASNDPSVLRPSIAPIMTQPGSFLANFHRMDYMSQQLYNSLPARHVSSAQIQSKISTATEHLMGTYGGRQSSSQEGISYENIVQSLTLKGEQVRNFSNNIWALPYTSVIFFDEQNKPFQSKPAGMMILTDKRYIFASSQFNTSLSLSEFGDPKNLPGGYNMKYSYHDNTFYLPLPLHNFYSVELRGSSGMSAEINITGEESCCGGMFGSCIYNDWNIGAPVSRECKELIIQMGVKLPPWGLRCYLVVNLAPNVSVPLARDFIALFQQSAINLM